MAGGGGGGGERFKAGDRKFGSVTRQFGAAKRLSPPISHSRVSATILRTENQLEAPLGYDSFARTHYPRRFVEREIMSAAGGPANPFGGTLPGRTRSWTSDKQFSGSAQRKFGGDRLFDQQKFHRKEKRTFICSFKMEPSQTPREQQMISQSLDPLSDEAVKEPISCAVSVSSGDDSAGSCPPRSTRAVYQDDAPPRLSAARGETSAGTVQQSLKFPRYFFCMPKLRAPHSDDELQGREFRPRAEETSPGDVEQPPRRSSLEAVRRSMAGIGQRSITPSLETMRRSQSAMGFEEASNHRNLTFVV
jgi:hypothetical protein